MQRPVALYSFLQKLPVAVLERRKKVEGERERAREREEVSGL